MRKRVLFIILYIQVTVVFGDEIDTMINKINQNRDSNMTKSQFISLDSPIKKIFIKESNSSMEDGNNTNIAIDNNYTQLTLTAIVNDSAYINKHWLKESEEIEGYKLIDIMDDSVYLESKSKKQLIFFKKRINKVNILIDR